MREILELLGAFALMFLGAAVSSWLAFFRMGRREVRAHELGGGLLLRYPGGVCRSRLIGQTGIGLELHAPLYRDQRGSLRPGDPVTVQAATSEGSAFFRSEVLEYDRDTGNAVLRRPQSVHRVDRRLSGRVRCMEGTVVCMDGETTDLLDLSERGARLGGEVSRARGDRLRLEFPWSAEPAYAWVVGADPANGVVEGQTRVIFEENVSLDAVKGWQRRRVTADRRPFAED